VTEELKSITEADLARIEALDGLREQTLRVRVSNDDPAQVQNVKIVCQLADAVPSLLAEVRRLRGLQRVTIVPASGPLLGKEVVEIFERQQATIREMQENRNEWRNQFYDERARRDRVDADLFSANVEIDNLRKRIEDLTAERDHERHQKELRHQAWLEATGQAKPVPMCRPDALEDLFPSAEGRPT